MNEFDANDVVISGISGVYPKADNVKQFAEKLFAKENLLSSVPSVPVKYGKLNDLSKFDAEFFDFHQPHRVKIMEPQSRIIMEKTYEALIDSGTNPVTLKGTNCGVYVGVHYVEQEMLVYDKIEKGASLALSRSFLANRISYWLGIHGPSYTIDAACSSTLVALEAALKAIRRGDCDSALVGGCNVCLHPALFVHLLKVGALSTKSESRVFDENASGFCKAECVGIFYLQKAKDAKRIYARVLNAEVNHDGAKPLFLSPWGPSQAKLLKRVYEKANIDTNSVEWIEAHATGTLVGDKQEITALDNVFATRRSPLMVGSVKSNMGHAESAAGVGSLTKVIVAMETGFIPPNINLINLRKDIDAFQSGRIKIVTEKTPWVGGIVGVSGFGMGGVNCHVVLKSFEKEKINFGLPKDDLPRIVGVSGRTEEAVETIINEFEKTPVDVEFVALLQEIHEHAIVSHPYRGFAILNKINGCSAKKIQKIDDCTRPIVIIFASLIYKWNDIYKILNEFQTFRTSISIFESILKKYDVDLIHILKYASRNPTLFECHIAAVTIQMALLELLKDICVRYDSIIGCYFERLAIDEALKIACQVATSLNSTRTFENPSNAYLSEIQQTIQKLVRNLGHKSDLWLPSSLTENTTVKSEYNEKKYISGDSIVIELLTVSGTDVLENCLKSDNIRIRLCDENTTNVDFLSNLGQLYIHGKNPSFQRLYPKVEFPVSRGTKMISPLIRWKHTTKWPVVFSSSEERVMSGERKISVSLADKQYTFIAGHEIDSNVLYPATGYLVLIWETFAQIYGKFYTDVSVVFENVRFLKAVVVQSKTPVTFDITIQKSTGIFEILHNNDLVTAGRIRAPANVFNEKVLIKLSKENDTNTMDKMDFYKYALSKSYNYKGHFRSIVRINLEGTQSRVSWIRNWVTYLDGMLQMTILHDPTEAKHVPVEIEKIIIDVEEHAKILESNVSELDVVYDQIYRVIESGGVQIKGLILRAIPSKSNPKPSLQKLTFASYLNNEQKIPMEQAICLFGQVIMDKLGHQTKCPKMAEILEEANNISIRTISSYLSNFIGDHPIYQTEIKTYVDYKSEFKKYENDAAFLVGNLPLSELVEVIVSTRVLDNNQKLIKVLNSLQDDGFLIAREDINYVCSIPTNLDLCCHVIVNDERLLLLKKKTFVTNSLKLIRISCESFDWIPELQEILKAKIHSRIWLLAEKEPFSGILGFYNCLRREKETEQVRCIFIVDKIKSFSLEDKFFKSQIEKDLAVNIYENGEWGCYVRQTIGPLPMEDVFHAFVDIKHEIKPFLRWSKGPLQPSNVSADTLVHVYYSAINSTDILVYKRRLAPEILLKNYWEKDYVLGMEFAGRENENKRCMGLRTHGCLSTHIKLTDDDLFVNEVPNNWSLEEAVTVPLAYYSAIYALIVCARLKNKETVLIYSAGNSIGQAAINIAHYHECSIFVGVSSIDEKLFIKQNFPFIPHSRIVNAADPYFTQTIFEETKHNGINIVLNALPESKIGSTIDCLSRNGRLIQIKRADMKNGTLDVNKLLANNISLYSALLDDLYNLPKDSKIELKKLLDLYLKFGAIKPLIRTTYCYEGIESAFEYAASTRNFAKCVVQIKPEEEQNEKPGMKLKKAYPRFSCDPDRSYVICGGLGGMGVELINWLINRGARKIVIACHKNDPQGSNILRINRWKRIGARIKIVKVDISKSDHVEKLLNEANDLGSVSGIFNLAAVLRDKTFKNQTVDFFETIAAPKLQGTYNLDEISRIQCPNLDHFVIFSSISSSFGNIGQTNYGMFNAAAERICEMRRDENLPALAVEWGAVGNVGMFVSLLDDNVDTNKSYDGVHMQPIKSCWDALDQFICQRNATIVISSIIADKKRTE